MSLTGRMRIRAGRERDGIFGSSPVLILQVEETYFWPQPFGKNEGHRWRDARVDDLPLPFARSDEVIEFKPPPLTAEQIGELKRKWNELHPQH